MKRKRIVFDCEQYEIDYLMSMFWQWLPKDNSRRSKHFSDRTMDFYDVLAHSPYGYELVIRMNVKCIHAIERQLRGIRARKAR